MFNNFKDYFLSKTNICIWRITEGKACVCKEVVEDIDQENKKVSFRVIEGDILGPYKSFKFYNACYSKGKWKCSALGHRI